MREERGTLRLRAEVGDDVDEAARIVRAGGLVAFPTETVYGLGANALDAEAVAQIFAAKGRPSWDPLIVHGSDERMLLRVAEISGEVGARARRLMETFWPGPLTLLLPRTAGVPDAVTAGRARVGVRMPRHDIAIELIRRAGVPIAAPSANRFGRTSPTCAAHVLEDLDGRIDAVLDGGPTPVGVESTVLDVCEWPAVIYRPGAVTAEMIRAVIGEVQVFRAGSVAAGSAPEALPSPGVGLRHYAPRARLVLVRQPAGVVGARSLRADIGRADIGRADIGRAEIGRAEIGRAEIGQTGGCRRVGVMLPDGWDGSGAAAIYAWGPWGDGGGLARRLFDGLRALDAMGVEVIVCPLPEAGGVGDALRDRLEKAARSA